MRNFTFIKIEDIKNAKYIDSKIFVAGTCYDFPRPSFLYSWLMSSLLENKEEALAPLDRYIAPFSEEEYTKAKPYWELIPQTMNDYIDCIRTVYNSQADIVYMKSTAFSFIFEELYKCMNYAYDTTYPKEAKEDVFIVYLHYLHYLGYPAWGSLFGKEMTYDIVKEFFDRIWDIIISRR